MRLMLFLGWFRHLLPRRSSFAIVHSAERAVSSYTSCDACRAFRVRKEGFLVCNVGIKSVGLYLEFKLVVPVVPVFRLCQEHI